jgi:hypothetical protein
MSLQEKLDAIREKAKERIPAEARAVMERATEDLRASGILDRVIKVGERVPDFELPDTSGRMINLATLRAHGPVVLSFYRGRW